MLRSETLVKLLALRCNIQCRTRKARQMKLSRTLWRLEGCNLVDPGDLVSHRVAIVDGCAVYVEVPKEIP